MLILPSGSYRTVLTDGRLDDVKAWIRAGGRLITLGSAAAFLAGKDGFALKRKEEKKADEKEEEEPERFLIVNGKLLIDNG